MKKQPKKTPLPNLRDAYHVPGFHIQAEVAAHDFESCRVFILTLDRRAKKQCAADAIKYAAAFMTHAGNGCAILDAATAKCISTFPCAA
jgi:hypothetical protein